MVIPCITCRLTLFVHCKFAAEIFQLNFNICSIGVKSILAVISSRNLYFSREIVNDHIAG